jgi:galactokinase
MMTPADRLRAAGMSPTGAANKVALFNRATRALDLHGVAASRADWFYVPGRIEVLGKHTDYAGGRSLLCTVERGVCLVSVPRRDNRVRIVDVGWKAEEVFEIGPDLVPHVGHWSNYPMTVARRVARNFPGARFGCDMAFVSDLPAAAGMSSSSVLMVAVFLALAEANELSSSRPYD